MNSKIGKKLLSLLLVFSLIVPNFLVNFVPAVSAAENNSLVENESTYLSVENAIANNVGEATVKGFIVGVAKSGKSYYQEAPFTEATNIGLADSPTETDASKILPVQLPKGDIRTALNLVDNPSNLGKEVTITGNLEAYFAVPGLKGAKAYTFVGDDSEEPTEPEAPEAITIAEARSQASGKVTVKGVVTAKLNNTIHIQDATAAIAVRPSSLNVEIGEEITVTGNLGDYKGLLQLNDSTLIGDVKTVGELSPKTVSGSEVNEDNESQLVQAKNITLTSVDSYNNYTATDGTTEFIVRDETGKLGFKVDTTYESITGIVQQFNNDYQIIPRSTADIVGDLEQPEVQTETISIAEAREKGAGATVIIEGIATTNTGLWGYDTFYMQDETAGMFVFGSPQQVKPGEKVKITGKLLVYKNELEIDPSNLEIISSGNPLPEAKSVKEVTEETQGELIKLENITITDLSKDGYGTALFTAEFESGEKVRVIHDNRSGSTYDDLIKLYQEGDKVHLTGISSIDNDGYHLKTFGLDSYDLVNKPAVYAVQSEGVVPAGTTIELKSGIEGAVIYYTIDGSEPTVASTKYTEPIALGIGETTIKAIAVKDGNVSEVFSFTYEILNTEGITIRDIQGNGHVSKYEGSSVEDITGVVTHVINKSNFIMQDVDNADEDNTTSEAIQVVKSNHGVAVGSKVSVDGIVAEVGGGANLSKTQIEATNVETIGTAKLPEPLVVGKDIIPPNKIIDNDGMTSFDPEEDGIDFWESVEYMYVSFPNALVVGPPYSGDVPIIAEGTTNNVINNNGGLNIAADDYNPEKVFLDNVGNDNYHSGDKFKGDIVGVISYSSAGYQLLTDKDKLPEVTKANIQPEVTHIAPAEDKLTVAAYNIENFSNNKSNTPDEKVTRIAKTFVDNMKSPDIITLVEVQDNDGQTDSGNADASESYERLIKAIKDAGGPAYEWTDVEPVNNTNGGAPGGNIRVGYLYNPDRVTLVEGNKGTGTEANAWTEEGNLTLNPGVIDPAKFSGTRKPIAAEFEFKGEKVVVIGAHLNSKGGDQSLWGSNQPPKLNSEAERLGLAKAINEFINEGISKNSDVNIVVAGDMNDFEFTPALETLKGNELTNMVDLVPEEDRFSYFFQGNNQTLDHILVSNNLVNATTADMIHINANFTEEQGQASDHDPVLVQIDLANEEKADFELSIMHNNDTHAQLDNVASTVTAVNQYRAENPDALLLHAGDVFSGTLYFNTFLGQADLKFMNLMGYDAMTFGNHEFDLGSSPEGHQALVDFIKGAEFPFVSANVDFSKDEKFTGMFHNEISKESQNGNIYNGIVKEVNGEQVGIFGLTTEETAGIASPGSITFTNYIEEAEKAVKAFEEQGVDKIIALTHIGYNDSALVDNDLLLAAHVDGIDVIVGGHSHTELKEPVIIDKDENGEAKEEPTVIVQTGEYNNNLGVLDVTFDENGVVIEAEGQLLAIKNFEEDAKAKELLEEYSNRVKEVSNEEIGVELEKALENPRTGDEGNTTGVSVRNSETILGNLITDGMLRAAKEYDSKVIMAVQNGGGIRAAIDAGPITVGEVITVLPFGNTLSVMELTGTELKEAFEHSVEAVPTESGAFLHVAGGKVEFDSSKPAGERVVAIYYKDENGKFVEVNDEESYTIATNYFTAKGGDAYKVFEKAFEEGRVTDLGQSDWENFRDQLVRVGSENIPTETEGRIVDLAGTFELSIMHNNDTHAQLDNVARTVTAVNQFRAENPESLLLHAGDVFSGTLYFNTFLGKADLEFMNLLGYDAMTFGNHEFDLGSSPEGHQALVDFITEAQFPFVSANVDFSKDNKFTGIFHDEILKDVQNGNIYNGIVKEVNGEQVGIFGLTTEETAGISSPGSITFENYIEEAEKAVKAFEEQGVDKIIALTHIGYNDSALVDNDLLLAAHVDGIDVIVGGHSHTELKEPVIIDKDENGEAKEEPTVIVQTGEYNNNLGVLDVTFDENGVVIEADGQLQEIKGFDEDPEAAELLKKYSDKVAEVSNEEIGVVLEQALENPRTGDEGNTTGVSVRNSETILGNLITDGMLHAAKEYDSKVIMAVQNGGGIRAAIKAGPITVGEVITVLPFGNTLSVMELTGAELKSAFEHSVEAVPTESGAFLHVAGGKVEFDSSKPAGERVVAIYYKNENGEFVEINDEDSYTIATNYFTAKGGDNYDVFAKAFEEGRVTDLGQSDWENFRDHLVNVGSDNIPTEIEGRMVDLAGQEPGEQPEQPGEGNEEPGEGNEEPGEGNEEPGEGNEEPGEGNEEPGKGNEKPGKGNEKPGKGNEKPGKGNEKPGKGNEKPGKGNEEPGEDTKEQQEITIKPTAKGNKYTVDKDAIGELEDGATVVVEISNKKNATIALSKEAVEKLKAANAVLKISNGVVELQIPASILDGATDVIVKKMNVKDSSALAIYDFTIKSNGKVKHKFNDKVTLTFKVDSSKVKNPENVKVYYFNEETKKWELVGGKYNAQTGEVTAATDHFSTFGVFELDQKDQQVPGGQPLPDTASNTMNILIAGLVLVVVTGGLFFMQRRKA